MYSQLHSKHNLWDFVMMTHVNTTKYANMGNFPNDKLRQVLF